MRSVRFMSASVLLAALVACESPTAPEPDLTALTQAGATREASVTTAVELELTAFVSCAADGAGELVHVRGTFVIVSHIWTDGRGRERVNHLTNPQDVRGVGLTTGTVYIGAGMTRNAQGARGTTYNNAFLLVSRGGGGNLVVHVTFRSGLDREGNFVVRVDHTRVTCE